MTDETKYLKSLERETVEYFHALLPDEHDREYLRDADIEEMWGEYSRLMFASWLCHDSLTTDVALGMVRGWAAARHKRVDLENERDAAVQKIDRLREQLSAIDTLHRQWVVKFLSGHGRSRGAQQIIDAITEILHKKEDA